MFIRNIDWEYAPANNCRNGRFPQQQVFGEDKFKQLLAQCRSCNRVKSVLGKVRKTPLYARCQRKPAELFKKAVS